MENLTGQRIDRYEILELLGKGGMAMVYKAYDTRLERELAIKIIRRDAFPPEDLHDVIKRFEREAKSLARLSHPNIVKVMDYGEYEGSPFLVLEYFPGGTLKQKIGGLVAWQEAARLLLPIARGVEYAHNRGVIHRDIKPANILMTEDGEPTLSDFGIAKLFQGDKTTTLTGSGAAIGTPEYMAPEQWTGQTGPKSDMYSLGVILYEMVTGRRPYIADTPGGVFLKQVTEPLPLPGEIVPDLPESVERFLLKTLAKEPADRYADLGVFIKELESLLSHYDREAKEKAEQDAQETRVGQVVKKPFETKPEPKKQRSAKFPLWSIGLIAFAFLVLVMWGISSIPASPEATQTPSATQTHFVEPTPTLEIGSTMIGDDGATLVYVPEGEFTMGSDNGNSDEQPVHTVYLDAFWIDQTEATNKQYAACIAAGMCDTPSRTGSRTRDSYYGNSEFDEFPVIYVNWDNAKTYCEWAGRRLPTEAEWEKTARGTDQRTYPWGEGIDCQKANYNGSCVGDTSPVGNYKTGKSPYGAYDMAGNVGEWVNDWYSGTYYQNPSSSNPFGPDSSVYRVLRGGSWLDGNLDIRSTSRGWNYPSGTFYFIGFRCVRGTPP